MDAVEGRELVLRRRLVGGGLASRARSTPSCAGRPRSRAPRCRRCRRTARPSSRLRRPWRRRPSCSCAARSSCRGWRISCANAALAAAISERCGGDRSCIVGGMPDPLLGRWPQPRPVLCLIASAGAPDIRRERREGSMNNKATSRTTITRRALVAGAAAGTRRARERAGLGAALPGGAAAAHQGPAGLDGHGPARARRGLRPVGLCLQPALHPGAARRAQRR